MKMNLEVTYEELDLIYAGLDSWRDIQADDAHDSEEPEKTEKLANILKMENIMMRIETLLGQR